MALLELDDKFFVDERLEWLGGFSGESKFAARGRVLALWWFCIKNTSDFCTADDVEILTGWFNHERGTYGELLVKAKLAERVEGGYRIRGVKERFQWLEDYRERQTVKGKTRAETADRDERGRFLPRQDEGATQPPVQPSPAAPAESSFPVPVPVSTPISEKKEKEGECARAHAHDSIQDSTHVPTGTLRDTPPPKAGPPPPGDPNLAPENVQACRDQWHETLRAFKCPRTNLLASEEQEIVRAILREKTWKAVWYALWGCREQPKDEKFDPSKFLNLAKILHKDNFNRYVNLGIQAHHRSNRGAA